MTNNELSLKLRTKLLRMRVEINSMLELISNVMPKDDELAQIHDEVFGTNDLIDLAKQSLLEILSDGQPHDMINILVHLRATYNSISYRERDLALEALIKEKKIIEITRFRHSHNLVLYRLNK